MRLNIFAAIALFSSACVKPVTDPHAVGSNANVWRATLPLPPARAFDAAMRVLTDSSYQLATAVKDAGLIKTAYRKESEVDALDALKYA